MNFLSILTGLAAIPKLIDRFDKLIGKYETLEKRKWAQISARVERKLNEASTPEELKQVVVEVKHIIDQS